MDASQMPMSAPNVDIATIAEMAVAPASPASMRATSAAISGEAAMSLADAMYRYATLAAR